jgi:hypothetical protein
MTTRSRKRRAQKKHLVKAYLQVMELARAGSSLNLEIFEADSKIGTLVIGRGSLYWYGRNRRLRKRIDWTKFAEMMDELAYG